jgi:hypothetical protein
LIAIKISSKRRSNNILDAGSIGVHEETISRDTKRVERRESEYIRHGTSTFILSRDVATGTLVAPSCGPTRNEADFLAHVQAVVATDQGNALAFCL